MKTLIFMVTSLFITAAQAQEFGLLGGVHSGKGELVNSTGFSEDSVFSYRAGLAAKFELTNDVNLRTGLIYTSRATEYSILDLSIEYNFTYLDVPALFEFKINDMVGFFVGPVVAFNMSDKGKINDPSNIAT